MEQTLHSIRLKWAESDAKRDAGLTIPEALTRHIDIPYGPDPSHMLDVYYPKGTSTPLPTIISIHGGGWFTGSKESYSHYTMALACRGFTVVSFNYRLAPDHKFPAPLEDCCDLLRWVQAHASDYFIDLNNIFVVGDSAGGQLAFLLLTMLSSPRYAALFPFSPPENFQVRACGLNCGCYFIPLSRFITPKKMGAIFEAYFPEDYLPCVPQLKAQKYITKAFPPAFVMASRYDYLRYMAPPLHLFLRRKGVESRLKIYGTKDQKEVGHVFHLNCRLPLAIACNDEQCAFFRAHMQA